MASIEQRHFDEIVGLSDEAFEASWTSGSRFHNGALSWGEQTASWQTEESGVAELHRSGPAIDSLTLASRWMLDLVITERFVNHRMLTVFSVAAPP
jgi:hypothetical protein